MYCESCKWSQLGAQFFLVTYFISLLYMFRATMYPSSGQITVSMRHLVFVILCGWLSGMQGGTCIPDSHPQSDKYQCRISCFSWWWAHSRPNHVEKRNKHTKKNCAPSRLYLQDGTRMHGQQNIKYTVYVCCIYALRSEWMRFKRTDVSRCDSSSSLLFLFKASADKLCCMIIKVSTQPYTMIDKIGSMYLERFCIE
jgi:hypothetical protein